jgi:hypothetical protein
VRGGKFLFILDGISAPPIASLPLDTFTLVIWHRSSIRYASLAYIYSLIHTLLIHTRNDANLVTYQIHYSYFLLNKWAASLTSFSEKTEGSWLAFHYHFLNFNRFILISERGFTLDYRDIISRRLKIKTLFFIVYPLHSKTHLIKTIISRIDLFKNVK